MFCCRGSFTGYWDGIGHPPFLLYVGSIFGVIMSSVIGLVAEYLSLVPHDRKFVSISTGDLITNSIKWRPEFSLAKAANAFRAVEQYAANLINQPWRQEFWKIRQYSGFYKHSVETALSGADKLFLEMGYNATSNQVNPLDRRAVF